MTTHLFRVTVRGQFDHPDETTAAALRAVADEHDALTAAFTPDGTFVYDRPLVAFSFRFEMRSEADDRETASQAAAEGALAKAHAHLGAAGIPSRNLRTSVTDMAAMWERPSGAPWTPRRARSKG